jgi:hypothetical protein
MTSPAALDWVAPALVQVHIWEGLAARVRGAGKQPRHEAMLMTFEWVLHGGVTPIGGLQCPADDMSVRNERWAALLVATYDRSLTADEWRTAGRDPAPRVTVGDTAEWGYGVWRILAWLLGERLDVPVDLADGHRRAQPWEVLPTVARAEIEHARAKLAAGPNGGD